MKFRPRAGFLVLGFVLVLLLLAYFRRDLGTAYVASQFRAADTADAELEAAARIKNWIHWTRGYRVAAQDAQGSIIKPHETKNFEAVTRLKITWDNGTTVERKILNSASLHYIYGE